MSSSFDCFCSFECGDFGKMIGSSLQSSNKINPREGISERMILPSSSMMRSFEMISIRFRFRSMAANVSFSMWKFS